MVVAPTDRLTLESVDVLETPASSCRCVAPGVWVVVATLPLTAEPEVDPDQAPPTGAVPHPVDTVRVKGRRKPEHLFMPYRRPDPEWVADYLEGRKKYGEGDFAGAREIFARLAEGGLVPPLAKRFLTRCEVFLEKPPGPEWAGVWDFFEK